MLSKPHGKVETAWPDHFWRFRIHSKEQQRRQQAIRESIYAPIDGAMPVLGDATPPADGNGAPATRVYVPKQGRAQRCDAAAGDDAECGTESRRIPEAL